MTKLPISVMIVGYNESRFLSNCFKSINFCNEIVYIDLGSTDNSLIIARAYASQIYLRSKVPSCEMIQTEIVNYLTNDWVIFIDPDENVDVVLAEEIQARYLTFVKDDKLGGVTVPWQFYFKRHKLKGTVWGGVNHKYLLVNRHRFSFDPVIHYGRKLKDDFIQYTIESNSAKNNVLHHYWMEDFRVFVKKHLRYVRNEGKDKYDLGIRTSWKNVLLAPSKEFYRSFFTLKGYKDGFIGLALSVFWALYQSASLGSLYINQFKYNRKSGNV